MFFLLAATGGLLLRMSHAGFTLYNYKFVMHTHSHIALLGWLYNAVLIALQYTVFRSDSKKLNRIFWLSQITFAGMLFSFPFQGYGLFSITFSTLYLFASYYLVYLYFGQTARLKNRVVARFIRWGGIYLAVSSIGPFSLGAIMANGLEHTFWYKLSVYWFIHFLYNGFFVFAVFALVLNSMREGAFQQRVFRWMNASVVPLYLLSVLWIEPHSSFYAVAFAAAAMQAVAFSILVFRGDWNSLPGAGLSRGLLLMAWSVYGLKIVAQLAASFPAVQKFLAGTVSTAIIGYLHLVMLGFFTMFFLSVFTGREMIRVSALFKTGLGLLLAGIVMSETVLLSQSVFTQFLDVSWPDYYRTLFYASSPMPLGILLMTAGVIFQKNQEAESKTE